MGTVIAKRGNGKGRLAYGSASTDPSLLYCNDSLRDAGWHVPVFIHHIEEQASPLGNILRQVSSAWTHAICNSVGCGASGRVSGCLMAA